MRVDEIISALSQDSDQFPEQALVAARDHWTQLVPEINATFERVLTGNDLSDEDEIFLFWAVLLIGDRKEKDCFESLMLFLDQDDGPGSMLDRILGDALCENVPNIVAIIADGRTEPLNKMLLSSQAGEYVKVGMLRVLKHMLFNEELTTNYFETYASLWAEPMIANQQFFALSSLGEMLIDFKLSSFQPMYLDFLEKDYIDYGMLNEEQINNWSLKTSCECRLDHYGSFDVMSVKNWASFLGDDKWNEMFNPFAAFIEEPYIADKTPGRNDPCFCGSGKKYKKCCLN